MLSEVENEYWFTRNGHRIEKSKQYRYEKNRALRLKKVQWTDAGEYVCYAKNAAGTVSRKITVSIFGESFTPAMDNFTNFRIMLCLFHLIYSDPVLSKTKGGEYCPFRLLFKAFNTNIKILYGDL